ncbi:MAG: helical backbone metal receptor [Candidatus Aegiribacteria sp.]
MRCLLAAAVLAAAGCSTQQPRQAGTDNRFIVLGPSLVELMFESGLGDRIVGVDRYSTWPPGTEDIPGVGGYVDPSVERIVALEPTSIHVSGRSSTIREIAGSLGVPCYSYDFDSLEGVFSALDSLDARYGAGAARFRERLEARLDSLEAIMEPVAPLSVMIVVYHEKGSSSMTVAGRETFFADILERVGCEISSPGAGSWPMVSTEGVLSLSPDHIILLFPGRTDSAAVRRWEEPFWESLGFQADRIHCLFQPYMMIPGGRLGETAERICSCLLW